MYIYTYIYTYIYIYIHMHIYIYIYIYMVLVDLRGELLDLGRDTTIVVLSLSADKQVIYNRQRNKAGRSSW